MAERDDAPDARRSRNCRQRSGAGQLDLLKITAAAPPLRAFQVDNGVAAGHRAVQGFFIGNIAGEDLRRMLSSRVPRQAPHSPFRQEHAHRRRFAHQPAHQMTPYETSRSGNQDHRTFINSQGNLPLLPSFIAETLKSIL